jgi:hypothetical protein
LKTPKKKLAYIKKWQKSHRDKVLKYKRLWRESNPEKMQKARDVWASKNKIRIRRVASARKIRKYHSDPQFKIEMKLRRKINKWIFSGYGAGGLPCKVKDYVGADKATVRKHIESQFKKGMNWGNHEFRGWHFDHKIPVSRFDLTKRDELLKCFHYTNMQPLWHKDHIRKHGKTPKL